MSSRAESPSDDPLSDIYDAMDQNSPTTSPARPDKRPHSSIDDGNEDDEDVPTVPQLGSAPALVINQNISVAATRYAERKRLKPDQIAAVDTFLHDPANLREVKLLVHLMAVENQVNKIITATAPYQVSVDLEKNIANYGAALLLSSKIRTYKGSSPVHVLVEIVKRRRFDLPIGIEHNPADFSKVIACIQDTLTQKRSKFKKLVKHSVKAEDRADHPNIFQLSQLFVDGTQCSVNVPLCARVALMRKVYLKHPGTDFWDQVDKDLASIRKKAGGDNKKIIKAFRFILTADQDTHGSKNDYVIEEEAVDAFQQSVDDMIDANTMDAATTVTATA